MKKLNKALIATAVLAGLSAGQAFAGTEACFEVYKVATGAGPTIDSDTNLYQPASCADPRTGIGTNDLAPIDEVKAAYEIAGGSVLGFQGVNTANDDLHIVYVPTTDIPSGTLITIKLTGAVFSSASNQIHLLRQNTVGGALQAVASTDGAVNNQDTITFLTKAGITIGAGTRLAFSTLALGANETAVSPIAIKVAEATCTTADSSASVTIESFSATTDGGTGFPIAGGKSRATLLADITPQYFSFWGNGTADQLAIAAEVNAEATSSGGGAIIARTEFVYDPAAVDQLTKQNDQVVYPGHFFDRGNLLDKKITLGASDYMLSKFVATNTPDAANMVKMAIYNSATASSGVLADPINVEVGTLLGDFGLSTITAPEYDTVASNLFTPVTTLDVETNAWAVSTTLNGALYNRAYYSVTNTDPVNNVMNFNYDVTVNHTLNFANAAYLDHCNKDEVTHKIGVNGAVLRVPYQFSAENNFVRITNRHNKEASITVDVFGESTDGTVGTKRSVTAVSLGTVPAESSVVFFVPKIIEEATAQKGYSAFDGNGAYVDNQLGSSVKSNKDRHSLTFTVTAPRNSVEGVAVQRMLSGQERVLPVNSLSDWNY